MTARTRKQIRYALDAVANRSPQEDIVDVLADTLGIHIDDKELDPGWYLHSDGSAVYLYDVNERHPKEVRLYVTDSNWARRESENLIPAKVVQK